MEETKSQYNNTKASKTPKTTIWKYGGKSIHDEKVTKKHDLFDKIERAEKITSE